MRYLVRALKYFVYLSIMLVLFIVILCLLGVIPKDIDLIFINGTKSLPQMALIVAVFAAMYPKIGFTTRNVRMAGEASQTESELTKFMNSRRYVLVKKEGEDLVYRRASVLDRIVKMGEDKIYFKKVIGGYAMEGLTKDVVRIDTGLTQFLDPEQ